MKCEFCGTEEGTLRELQDGKQVLCDRCFKMLDLIADVALETERELIEHEVKSFLLRVWGRPCLYRMPMREKHTQREQITLPASLAELDIDTRLSKDELLGACVVIGLYFMNLISEEQLNALLRELGLILAHPAFQPSSVIEELDIAYSLGRYPV